MTRRSLIDEIQKKKTYLCIGLDTDITKIPKYLQSYPDAIFEFNKQIIDATKDLCVAYKINTAFYEAMGAKGWEMMQKTESYIPSTHFKIADAKRGDIGNTSSQYAKAFFETMNFDAITVAPYMGEDSVKPFLEYEGKWAIVLGLTSNKGANDFELKRLITWQSNYARQEPNSQYPDNIDIVSIDTTYVKFLYEEVLETASQWGNPDNLMFVIGATQASAFVNIRKLTPHHFYLVPGVGAQGGSLKEISEKALIKHECGLLVNVSRAVIYASDKKDFAEKAREIAVQYQKEMENLLSV